MNSILFYTGLILAALILLSFVPGLKHLVRPIIDSTWKMLQATFVGSGAWFIYGIKLILVSHIDIIRHLTLSKSTLDPVAAVRDEEAGRNHKS